MNELGEPIEVGAVRLIPVVHVRRVQRRFMPEGRGDQPLGGMVAVSLAPKAVHVLDGAGGRTLYVPDPARGVWIGLLVSLVLAPLISNVIVRVLSNVMRRM
jgi:hypothetical protein